MRVSIPVLLTAVVVAGCGGSDDAIARYEAACRDLPALEDVGLPGRPAPELAAAVERIAAVDGEPAFVEAVQAIRRASVADAAGGIADRYRVARDAAREAGIDCPALAAVADALIDPGEPNEVEIQAPAGSSAAQVAVLERGKRVLAQSGCLACHRIGDSGGDLGPNLTRIGDRLDRAALARVLVDPVSPMPSFRQLPAGKRAALVAFMASLRG